MKLAPAFAFIAASLALVTCAEPQPVPEACLCGKTRFTAEAAFRSRDYACRRVPCGIASGGNYPHVFKNDQHLTLPWCHPTGADTFIDYPLESPVWTSGSHSPGPHRVVYRQSTGELCGCVTHEGASSIDGFKACKHVWEGGYSDIEGEAIL